MLNSRQRIYYAIRLHLSVTPPDPIVYVTRPDSILVSHSKTISLCYALRHFNGMPPDSIFMPRRHQTVSLSHVTRLHIILCHAIRAHVYNTPLDSIFMSHQQSPSLCHAIRLHFYVKPSESIFMLLHQSPILMSRHQTPSLCPTIRAHLYVTPSDSVFM